MPPSLSIPRTRSFDELSQSFRFAEGTRPVSFAIENEEEVEQFSCSTCTYVLVRREKGETEEGPVTFVVGYEISSHCRSFGPKNSRDRSGEVVIDSFPYLFLRSQFH